MPFFLKYSSDLQGWEGEPTAGSPVLYRLLAGKLGGWVQVVNKIGVLGGSLILSSAVNPVSRAK